MTLEAPAALQPIITASPTAPHPHTATLKQNTLQPIKNTSYHQLYLLPGSTLAVFKAAPYPGCVCIP